MKSMGVLLKPHCLINMVLHIKKLEFQFRLIDSFSKKCLIGGLDELGYLLSFSAQIGRYEEGLR